MATDVTSKKKKTPFAVCQGLLPCLRTIVETYQGYNAVKSQALISEGKDNNLPRAYYDITQCNAELAVKIKNTTFLAPHTAFWGESDKWQKQMTMCLPWWKTDFKVSEEDFSQTVIDALRTRNGGTYSQAMKGSRHSTVKGTYLHEKFGRTFAKQALPCRWQSLSVITPGRLISPTLSVFGCTPDALTVRKEDSFLEYYVKTSSADPLEKMVGLSEELPRMAYEGAPLFVHEFKTLHKPDTKITRSQLDRLKSVANDDVHLRAEIGDLLRQALMGGGWSTGEKPPIRSKKRTRDGKLLFTGKRLPFATRGTNRLNCHSVGFENCVYDGDLFRHLEQPGCRVPLDRYLSPKSWGTYTVYDVDEPGRVLFHQDLDESPYILSPICDHMCQMLAQSATVISMNEDAIYVLSVIMSYESDKDDGGLPLEDDTVPALQFSMQVPINAEWTKRHIWRTYEQLSQNNDDWKEYAFTKDTLDATISSDLKKWIAQPGTTNFSDPPSFPNIQIIDL